MGRSFKAMFVPDVHSAQNYKTNLQAIMEKKKTKAKTIARGYRLRPKTHKLIMRLQKKLNRAADDVLWDACDKLYRQVSLSQARQL
jgi:hypothetical protein